MRLIKRIDIDVFMVESTDGDKCYRVEYVRGVWVCNCTGFLMHGMYQDKDCIHIAVVKQKFPEISRRASTIKVRCSNPLGYEIDMLAWARGEV